MAVSSAAGFSLAETCALTCPSSDLPLPLWTEWAFAPCHCSRHRPCVNTGAAQKPPYLLMKRRNFGCFLYVHGGAAWSAAWSAARSACSGLLSDCGAFEGSGRGSGPPTVPLSTEKPTEGKRQERLESAGKGGSGAMCQAPEP